MNRCRFCNGRIWYWQRGTFSDQEHESCAEKDAWQRWPHSELFKEFHRRHFGKEVLSDV